MFLLALESTISSQYIYQGRILSLRLDTVQLSNGLTSQREIVEHGGAVVVAPIDGDGNVIMVRQYRKAVEKVLLELPAGGLNAGEDPQVAAARELKEETGYTVGTLRRLGGFYLAPGYSSEYIHLFLATDLTKGQAHPEEDEELEVISIPLSTIPGLLAAADIEDAKSIAGLLQVMALSRSDS
ncbi:MAG: NUDIX hydrolase [Dehalococcoidia bacterium]|nr:NUDIX hydrolase [Dehalococcoidia bacterium]